MDLALLACRGSTRKIKGLCVLVGTSKELLEKEGEDIRSVGGLAVRKTNKPKKAKTAMTKNAVW